MTSRAVAKYDFNSTNIKHEDAWNSICEKSSGKRKRDNSESYVSGSSVKNYLLKDPVLDWLDLYYDKNNEDIKENKKRRIIKNKSNKSNKINKSDKFNKINKINKSNKNDSNLMVLLDAGNEFEDKVMDHLNRHFADEMLTINKDGRLGVTNKNYKKTIDAMNKGIPIIAQAVLFNNDNKTSGVADLIVRSDYLNKVVNRPVLNLEKESITAPKLKMISGLSYHYRVIDIKWTTMNLCANGYTIRNDNRFPCYKGQLAIYNSMIGAIQGYTPSEAYILAKGWKIDKKNNPQEGYNCFDLLGVIDYDGFDYPFINKTAEAIKWVKDVRKNGASWNPYKPHREEMYPNASNKNDAPWTKVKKDICENINEITQIWFVNEQHRKNAHAQGIMSWKDEMCNSQTMGITGDSKPNVIDAILEINRDPKGKISPENITNDLLYWQTSSPVDFYVDFETINECFYNPEVDIYKSKVDADFIFMIGVGYIENNEWKYKVFTANKLTSHEEFRVVDEFTKFIDKKSKELDPENIYVPRLFHWSQAEVTNFMHVNMRHSKEWIKWQTTIEWVDMYNVFTSEPIVVKGALNFRLKEIGKAMYKLGLIKTKWNDDGPGDGLGAMMDAVKYYKQVFSQSEKSSNNLTPIINYNEVDCKIIWEIVKYLRENHCSNNDDYKID